jgi:hypothetical protein
MVSLFDLEEQMRNFFFLHAILCETPKKAKLTKTPIRFQCSTKVGIRRRFVLQEVSTI